MWEIKRADSAIFVFIRVRQKLIPILKRNQSGEKMFSGYDFSIYWGVRKESPAEIARRMSKMLLKLKPLSPLLNAGAVPGID